MSNHPVPGQILLHLRAGHDDRGSAVIEARCRKALTFRPEREFHGLGHDEGCVEAASVR